METQELELRFDHGVIEHLGVKLYQNKPTNVIAERSGFTSLDQSTAKLRWTVLLVMPPI